MCPSQAWGRVPPPAGDVCSWWSYHVTRLRVRGEVEGAYVCDPWSSVRHSFGLVDVPRRDTSTVFVDKTGCREW